MWCKKIDLLKKLVDNECKKVYFMKKITDIAFGMIARMALDNARKEVNSACIFIGYQPKMPEKVHELKREK